MKIDNRLPGLVAVGLAVSGLGGAGWLRASPAVALLGVRAAAAEDMSKQTGSSSSAATVSAHASASVSSSSGAGGAGCVVESAATAEARAGEQHQRKSDHKRIERATGPCEASAEAHAKAQAGDPPPAESQPE